MVFTCCGADDKKEQTKKPEPPAVVVVIPLSVTAGATNKIIIRGQNLTNVTELRFSDTNCHADYVIRAKSKAEVPKEMEAKKVGDTQLEVELKLAGDTALGTNNFTVI